MLATLEVVMNIAVVFVGLPSGVYNLIANRHFYPPGRSWFAKCYRAERYLFFAHNLLLLVTCAEAIVRLGLHFGYVYGGVGETLTFWARLASNLTLAANVGLFIRAAIKVHRNGAST